MTMPLRSRHTARNVQGARSSDELVAMAGPDFAFRVEARPALFERQGIDSQAYGAAPAQVLVRSDTEEALSVVGSKYVPAQVADFLAPLDHYLREGQLRAVRAVSFDRGLTQVVELEFPQPIELPGPNGSVDVLLRRVLWRNTNDGSSSLSLMDSLLRRWCANGAAHVIGMSGASFRHVASKMKEALDLNAAIEAATARFQLVEHNARALLGAAFSRGQMNEVVDELYPTDEDGEVSTRSVAAREAIVQLFERGAGNRGASAWDAANAVTEWSTHHRPTRGTEKELSRLKAIWMGDAQAHAGIAAVARHAGVELTVN